MAVAVAVLATAGAASTDARVLPPLQHDGGTPGDASDLCADPDPELSRDTTTTGRHDPLPGEGPASDTRDHYGLTLQAGDEVTVTTGAALASTSSATGVDGDDTGIASLPTVFGLRVWVPGCGELVGPADAGPPGGESVTFTAPEDGTYVVEVHNEAPTIDSAGSGSAVGATSGEAPHVQTTCHPQCNEVVRTSNLVVGYSLTIG